MPFRSWAGACSGGCHMPIGPSETVGKSRESRTGGGGGGVDVPWRRWKRSGARGLMVAAHLPSFLRTPCLRVSFSQCRKPTYVALSLSLAPSLFPIPFAFFATIPPRASALCVRRCAAASLPLLSVSRFALFSAFTAPLLWTSKLFGRRLLISWPRLSSSGLVLTRRYSSHRIHRIRIVRDVPNTFSRGANNLCDQACMYDKSQCSWINLHLLQIDGRERVTSLRRQFL